MKKFPDGSKFIPSGGPVVVGIHPNPAHWENWGKTEKATLFVGLSVGRPVRYPSGFEIPEDWLYGVVFRSRTEQVGVEYGGSFVRQIGHYIPRKAKSAGSEARRRETSAQVTLFPAPAESWVKFVRNIEEVVNAVLESLEQESVIVEYTKGGIPDIGRYVWSPRWKRKPL